MIVVDASALVETLLQLPLAAAVEAKIFGEGETLHAPHLIDVEVAQVVRRYTTRGDIEPERASTALTDLADFPIQRYPHTFLLPRIWQLRSNVSAYDAAYVALAEALDAELITRDGRLAKAVAGGVRVRSIG